MTSMETWVLVSDGAGARVFRADNVARRLELILEERHEPGRAKASELMADRAGRNLDSTHAGGRPGKKRTREP